MRTFRHAKLMASTLRMHLAEGGTTVGHSESLEIVARQFGFRNWNTLAPASPPPSGRPLLPDCRKDGSPPAQRPKITGSAWSRIMATQARGSSA